ncbi:MAG: electron transport complex subunit RsxC [Prevotellaceae bacterium]|jgi:electron transport complex protein RnfC|nr:electron transport complex subunit RsxC [Prevotellaceae bacterium]
MLKTFSIGGIHPSDNKLSAQSALMQLPPEGTIALFLGQHAGAPAEPVVNKGDKVKVGQLVAKASGFISANIHASVSGTVAGIEPVADISGFKKPAIVIQVEGDEWMPEIDSSKDIVRDITIDSQTIIKKIAAAGLVGLGGAAFPTHVKLSPPPGKKAEALIINATECEPYLTADHRVMLEYAEEVLIGTLLLKKALNAPKVYIGIEDNKPDAIKLLKELVVKYNYDIIIVPLKKRYPQGGEKQLIDAIVGRQVPSMGLPVDVGVVVQNVNTAFTVYEAVQKNKPLFEHRVTITGKEAKQQVNMIVRVGTATSKILEAAGGMPESTAKIVCGGPMMGKAISNIDAPTTKVSSSILLISEKETKRKPESNCIRCAKCVEACPIGLEPYLLIKQAQRNMYDELEANRLQDCIECGCCLYSCPAHIPLLDYIRLARAEVLKIMRSRQK